MAEFCRKFIKRKGLEKKEYTKHREETLANVSANLSVANQKEWFRLGA